MIYIIKHTYKNNTHICIYISFESPCQLHRSRGPWKAASKAPFPPSFVSLNAAATELLTEGLGFRAAVAVKSRI